MYSDFIQSPSKYYYICEATDENLNNYLYELWTNNIFVNVAPNEHSRLEHKNLHDKWLAKTTNETIWENRNHSTDLKPFSKKIFHTFFISYNVF